MNKKHLSIISILFVLSILVAGCNPARDLSTPSTRLVGHWKGGKQGDLEVYIGKFDQNGNSRSFDNMTPDGKFRLLSCNITEEREDLVKMACLTEDGQVENDIYWPAKHGQTMNINDWPLEYVDSNTEP